MSWSPPGRGLRVSTSSWRTPITPSTAPAEDPISTGSPRRTVVVGDALIVDVVSATVVVVGAGLVSEPRWWLSSRRQRGWSPGRRRWRRRMRLSRCRVLRPWSGFSSSLLLGVADQTEPARIWVTPLSRRRNCHIWPPPGTSVQLEGASSPLAGAPPFVMANE